MFGRYVPEDRSCWLVHQGPSRSQKNYPEYYYPPRIQHGSGYQVTGDCGAPVQLDCFVPYRLNLNCSGGNDTT